MGFLNRFFHTNRQTLLKKRLDRPEYSYLFEETPEDEWVCLDMEMTGLNHKTDHILSLGAVKIIKKNNHLIIDTKSQLSLTCRPPIAINPKSIVIHGLRPMDVENGVDYQTLLQTFLPFLGARAIVGFCPSLDMAFLNALAKPYLGVSLANPLIDVSELDWQQRQKQTPDIPQEKAHLNELLLNYNIPLLPAHDSLNDALMTAMLFCHLVKSKP